MMLFMLLPRAATAAATATAVLAAEFLFFQSWPGTADSSIFLEMAPRYVPGESVLEFPAKNSPCRESGAGKRTRSGLISVFDVQPCAAMVIL